MTFATLLINQCDILRFAAGAQDAYGNPVKTWNVLHDDEPCRYSEPKNNEIKVGIEVLVYDLDLFLEDIDITVQDRVILNIQTYEILGVKSRQDAVGAHHKELAIRTVK
jgi:hypothetical protein